MHVLIEDDGGCLALRRLRPWHRLLAYCRAPRLDQRLAEGARPEGGVILAARAMRVTSVKYRRQLAASLRVVMAPRGARPSAATRTAVYPTLISGSAPELAELADRLTRPGPVPARGVAMVSQLLADGGGPLYHPARPDDLTAMIERAGQALAAV